MVAATDWLWESLVSCRHAHSVVTQLAPLDFDWDTAHPVHGTPLMAAINEIVRSGQVNRDVQAVLQWCLRQGADPRQTAAMASGYSGGWGSGTDEFPSVPHVPHAGRSAITLTLGLISVLERISVYEHKGKYQDQLSAAKQLLNIFAQFRAGVPSRAVAEATIEMWEEIQLDHELADLELHIRGDDCDGDCDDDCRSQVGAALGVVRAHSLVLCHASPVLRAALASGMVEGQTRVLGVPGASVAALELLLAVLYSGMLPERRSRRWAVGDRVDANWRGRGRWWSGSVAALHSDGTCDVAYDEGSYSERNVPPSLLRPPATTTGGSGPDGHCSGVVGQVTIRLTALDVAHRWQVGYAVALLEAALAEQVREGHAGGWFASARDFADHLQTFDLLCEAAMLKDLHLLRSACRHLAGESPEVRRHYELGSFGSIAMKELRGIFD